MRQQNLVLFVVFLMTLGLSVWLLMPDLFDSEPPMEGPRATSEGGPNLSRGSSPSRNSTDQDGGARVSSGNESDADGPSAAADREPGVLAILAADDFGSPVAGLGVSISPDRGQVVSGEAGGFRVIDLEPGAYRVTVAGPGFVQQSRQGIVVRAGETTRTEFVLERGVLPRGECFDATDLRPIAGVLVTFGDGSLVRSGENGRFVATHPITKTAANRVSVAHPQYDSTTFENEPILDPDRMRLALTRGKTTLVVKLTESLAEETEAPTRARLKLGLRIGGSGRWQTRRTIDAVPGRENPIRFLVSGRWRVEASFPGSDFTAVTGEVDVPYDGRVSLELVIRDGVTLSGTLEHGTRRPARVPVELRDERLQVIATTQSDPEGRFVFTRVPAGEYRLRARYHLAPTDSPVVIVPKEEDVDIRLDLVSGAILR